MKIFNNVTFSTLKSVLPHNIDTLVGVVPSIGGKFLIFIDRSLSVIILSF